MLFDNDFNVMDLSFFNIPNDKKGKADGKYDNNLYDVKEGFLRGNLFKNLYEPYKHYTYEHLVAKTKKEEVELSIYALDFAINDLNLYLDLHPDDEEAFKKFKTYIKECKSLKEQYKTILNDKMIDDVTSSSYTWIKNWPWEGKDNV